MSLIPAKINFKVNHGKATVKSYELLDADGNYDITDKIFQFLVYLDGPDADPTALNITKEVALSTLIINIMDGTFPSLGVFEYTLEEIVDPINIKIVSGIIEVLPYVPFSDTIQAYLDSELPKNIQLTPEYVDQRIRFWRNFLQGGFNISDTNLYIEEAWPVLANALLAKLVVYDAMLLAMSGNLVGFLGGDYTQGSDWGGSIKRIETGPASVEFHPIGNTFSNLFKAGANGMSAFDNLIITLCGLANKLGIKLPMCNFRKTTQIPQYMSNPQWAYPKLGEVKPPPRG